MRRRGFIGGCIAAVTGLFAGKAAAKPGDDLREKLSKLQLVLGDTPYQRKFIQASQSGVTFGEACIWAQRYNKAVTRKLWEGGHYVYSGMGNVMCVHRVGSLWERTPDGLWPIATRLETYYMSAADAVADDWIMFDGAPWNGPLQIEWEKQKQREKPESMMLHQTNGLKSIGLDFKREQEWLARNS